MAYAEQIAMDAVDKKKFLASLCDKTIELPNEPVEIPDKVRGRMDELFEKAKRRIKK